MSRAICPSRSTTSRIDERREAQNALNHFAAIVASTDDAIISCTTEGVITSWNAGAEVIFGYTADEMIGHRATSLIPEDRRDEQRLVVERVARGEHLINFETQRIHKDGHLVPVSATVSPILSRDFTGYGHGLGDGEPGGARQVVGATLIVRDISERQRIAAAAKREQEFSDTLLANMPGALYLFNSQGRYLRWNRNLLAVSGYTDGDMATLHPLDFFSDAEKPLIEARIAEVFAIGHTVVEAQLVARSGKATPYFFTGALLQFDGEPCLVGMGIDISARKSAEADLADYAARLQSISRQLLEVQENERRTLARDLHDSVGQELTALSLNLAFIRDEAAAAGLASVDTRLRDSLLLIETTTRHLRDIMVELRPAGIDELGLLAALKEHAARVAQRSGLKLLVTGSEPRPRMSGTMAIALFRIAQEAMNNTVKHGGATQLRVELQDGAGLQRLIIDDDGCGFDTSRRRPAGSDGMGMTTMRERAEAIGAALRVESAPATGTRVIVEYPWPAPAQVAPAIHKRRAADTAPDEAGRASQDSGSA